MQAKGLTQTVIGFAQIARNAGLKIGIEETFNALKVFDMGIFEDKNGLYYSLKTLFCTNKEDIAVFDELYYDYWLANHRTENISKESLEKIKGLQRKQQQAVLSINNKRNTEGGADEQTHLTVGANVVARLQKTDFSKVAELDIPLLDEIAQKLWQEMAKRLKRRMKATHARDKVDIRKTIRRSLQYGGDPIDLAFKGKKPKKMRLVVLLDVSGSMDKYSFFLLRFILTLQSYFEKVESFVFSTELRRITDSIKSKGLEKTMKQLQQNLDNWSSGTKIGECLQTFNDKYAKTILTRSSYTIILSDGLDTGEKGIIEGEMQKIKRRTKRLIWLNPLKGTEEYAPKARGMSEALSNIDVFQSAHNLESLLTLERVLMSI